MSKIVLGVTSDGKPFAIDLVLLLETRLLISANSGGGKSYTLRQLIEQIFGKVQIILVDREGEFKSLRDKFDFLLVGEGGDIPAHIGSARLLAEKLLESGVSAICDLYEAFRTRPIDRLAWVREFLMGLVDAPKNLWHDVVVIVDEAHIFCPEVAPKGRDMKERDIINGCKDAVVALATVGRKRGLAAVFATQRLAKLDKDASAELLNRMIGMTMEGQDVERAIDLMSIPREEKAFFKKSIRELEPGNLYAFGRAISKERILVKISPVETKHHDPRSRKHTDYSPPTPAKIRALLSKFEDLPKEIEAKAKTEADLRKENLELKQKVSKLERSGPIWREAAIAGKDPEPVIRTVTDVRMVPAIEGKELRAFERLLDQVDRQREKAGNFIAGCNATVRALADFSEKIRRAIEMQNAAKNAAIAEKIHPGFGRTKVAPMQIKNTPPIRKPVPVTPHAMMAAGIPISKKAAEQTLAEGCLTSLQLRQLRGLAEFEAIGISKVDRKWLAGWLGLSLSGYFKDNFSNLRTAALVEYDGPKLYLTDAGRQAAPAAELEATPEAILERCASAVSTLQARQLRHLYGAYPEWVGREELSQALELSLSGYFKDSFSGLHTAGMVDYGEGERKGKLRCAAWIFLEEGVAAGMPR